MQVADFRFNLCNWVKNNQFLQITQPTLSMAYTPLRVIRVLTPQEVISLTPESCGIICAAGIDAVHQYHQLPPNADVAVGDIILIEWYPKMPGFNDVRVVKIIKNRIVREIENARPPLDSSSR